MSILKLTLALALFVVVSLAGAGSVAAVGGSCPIGYTGPNSENQCISRTTYSCTINNNNVVEINGKNAQGSISGSTGYTGNTQGGDVRTGNATSDNNDTFNVTITSGGLCQAVQIIDPTTPTTSTTTTNTPTAPSVASSTPTKLADTSGDNTSLLVIAGLSVAGVTALAVRFGLPLVKYIRH